MDDKILEFLIEKGYRINDVLYMFGKDISINFISDVGSLENIDNP